MAMSSFIKSSIRDDYHSFLEGDYSSFIKQNKPKFVEPVKGQTWLDWYLDKEVRNGRSVFVGLFGRSQSGKSTLALQTAIRHDPHFTWDRVTYSGKEFLRQSMLEPPEGSYFIVDDAGAQMPANRWWDIRAQVFDFAQQVLGMYHWVVFITVPLDKDIISKVRNRFDIFIRLDPWRKGEGIIRVPLPSNNLTHPYTLFPFPKYISASGEYRELVAIKFSPLPPAIFDYYQEHKKRPEIMKYMQSWYDEYVAAEKDATSHTKVKRTMTEEQRKKLARYQFRPKFTQVLDPEKPLAEALREHDRN